MKRIDLGKIDAFKGKMCRMLEMGKSFLRSSHAHEKCENDFSECFIDRAVDKTFLLQIERGKAEGIAFFERQRRLI